MQKVSTPKRQITTSTHRADIMFHIRILTHSGLMETRHFQLESERMELLIEKMQ